jgi:hypothetical protein
MYIVGIDPGRTNGVCILRVEGNVVTVHASYETTDVQTVAAELENWAEFDRQTTVVIEDFVGSGMRSADHVWTMKAVGFFQLLSIRLGLQTRLNPPQARYAFITEAETLGLTSHRKAAGAHALSWARSTWRVERAHVNTDAP